MTRESSDAPELRTLSDAPELTHVTGRERITCAISRTYTEKGTFITFAGARFHTIWPCNTTYLRGLVYVTLLRNTGGRGDVSEAGIIM